MKSKISAIIFIFVIAGSILYFTHRAKQQDLYFKKNLYGIEERVKLFINSLKNGDTKPLINLTNKKYRPQHITLDTSWFKKIELKKIIYLDIKTAIAIIEYESNSTTNNKTKHSGRNKLHMFYKGDGEFYQKWERSGKEWFFSGNLLPAPQKELLLCYGQYIANFESIYGTTTQVINAKVIIK